MGQMNLCVCQCPPVFNRIKNIPSFISISIILTIKLPTCHLLDQVTLLLVTCTLQWVQSLAMRRGEFSAVIVCEVGGNIRKEFESTSLLQWCPAIGECQL